jgi:hypothetical protein
MDRAEKKTLRREFKLQEQAAARADLPLNADQLRDLLAFLDEQIFSLGIPCDHSLGRTAAWAEREQLNVADVVAGVRSFGGYCDCEVASNVTLDTFGW